MRDLCSYAVRRVLWIVPVWLGITLVVFSAIRLAPGDPAELRFGGDAAEGAVPASGDVAAEIARFRAANLLDLPLWRQYLHFLGPFNLRPDGHEWFGGSGQDRWAGALLFDFGREYQRPSVAVRSELVRRLAVTVPISAAALALAYFAAIPLGVWTATRRGRMPERAVTAALFLVHAIPGFWLGLLLILLFGATGLDWLPVLGLHAADADRLGPAAYAWDALRHAILPVAALSLGSLAYLSRQVRSAMLEALAQDYVRAARAVGLGERAVVVRHALRNALLPAITLFGAAVPFLVGGSVVVERVFDLPGMGSYVYEGLLARDYNVVQATSLVAALVTLGGILIADLGCALADPRIRLERIGGGRSGG